MSFEIAVDVVDLIRSKIGKKSGTEFVNEISEILTRCQSDLIKCYYDESDYEKCLVNIVAQIADNLNLEL